MRKWNKLLALVLAMVMVFGLTATAFAAENEPAEGEKTEATDPATEPAEGEEEKAPADEPDADAEGEDKTDAEDPAEGEDAKEPAEGEDAAEPAEGEDAAEPAEGETPDATEPTEPAAVTFSDVEEGRWFYEFVMKMAEAKVVNGYSDGTFRPDGKVNWGQALKMALLAAEYEDAAPVEGGSWASGYIALAKAEGIIAEDAEIDHNKNITRVEMCELLAKALKVAASEKESIFSDTDNGYVMALVELEIISVAETFNPDGELSRAELCKILASVPETTEPTEPAEGDEATEPTEGEDAKDPADEEKKDEADADADKADDADADKKDEGTEPAEGEDEPAEGEDDAEEPEEKTEE